MSKTRAFTVSGSTPVQIAMNDGPQQKTFLVSVETGGPITIGGPDITPDEGPTLKSTDPMVAFPLVEDDLWAVLATGGTSADVAVIETISGGVV